MSQQIFSLFMGGLVGLFVATAVSAQPLPQDEVLLSRGDVTVTRTDFMHMLESAVAKDGRTTALADERKVRNLIADLFVIRQLAEEARAAGLDEDELLRFKIATQRDRMLMDALLDKAVAEAGKPDFEKTARERYTASPERFRQDERVRVTHILIAPKDGRSTEQARALAEDLRKQALEGKKSFEELALEYSDDTSVKSNKGDLGFFEHDRMVKPFADAAFAMSKPGEISPVVESQFGFHLIRFTERKPARQLSFDEVKGRIIDKERQQFEARLRTERIEAARSLDGITVNQDAISAISAEAKKTAAEAVKAAEEKRAKKPAP